MSLATAFTGTIAGDFLFVTLVLVALKLLSALVQARLMRGNYRDMPDMTLFRLIYIIGKVTPALASFCAFVSAYLLHDRFHSWFFGCFTICAALLAIYVVLLRRQKRFFGVADLMSSAKRR